MLFTPYINEGLDSSDSESVESVETVEDLGKFLEGLGLGSRFEEVEKISECVDVSGDCLEVDVVEVDVVEEEAAVRRVEEKENVPEFVVPSYGDGLAEIKGRMRERMQEKSRRVSAMIEAERERRRVEAERRKREEEERRRREEAERKRVEEMKRREAEERKRQEAEKKRMEEDKKKAEEKRHKMLEERLKAEKEKAEKMKKEAAKQQNATDFTQVQAQFLKYQKDIQDIKAEVVLPMKQNAELRRIVNAQRRKLNPKFGQLTNSRSRLRTITSEVIQLISEAKANEAAYKWLLNFVAKAIVHQAEAEVSVKPKSALPLGSMALDLMLAFPEFAYFLLARLVKKCPVVIGYTCAIDTEEGMTRMGWRKVDEKWEDENRYNERLGGICTLFSVMTRTPITNSFVSYSASVAHPLPISKSWTMLSRVLNTPLKLVTNVHFVTIGCWWDACAAQFLHAYGKQSGKLLQALWNDWTAAVADRKYPAAARLRILGDEWSKTGKIDALAEMEQ